MSDAKSVARHVNDKSIIRFLSNLPYPYTEKDAKDWLKKKATEYKLKKPAGIVFAIEIDSEAVGSIGLHDVVHKHKAELGYWLGKKFWGRGIMTDAVKRVSEFGFKNFKLRRIYAKVYLSNRGLVRVLEKNGFKLEGIAKKEARKDGKFIDAYIFARVRRD